MEQKIETLGGVISALPSLRDLHARDTSKYRELEKITDDLVNTSNLLPGRGGNIDLGVYGTINFPYVEMGSITSLNLFGLDEMIIFAFYWANKGNYRNVCDIGANIGLHSILMAKCGWNVLSYEPDPKHVALMRNNIANNNISSILIREAAVSDARGSAEFVRVLGNTTSSHLSGAKSSAYGPLEKFHVSVDPISEILPKVDFIKMDAEGQERAIILASSSGDWDHLDMLVEVGTKENAYCIYEHLRSINVRAFSQKLGWKEVIALNDMPSHYTEGSLFITKKSKMEWGNL